MPNAEMPAVLIRWFVVSLPFAAGLLSSVALTALLIRVGSKRHWVAVPRQDRWNKRAVVKFGGVPILLAFSVAALLHPVTRENLVLFLLTSAMGLVGLVDDLLPLGPRTKLLAQVGLGGFAAFGGIVHRLSGHFWLDALFTVFWIVAITNAFNLLDNMDGLAAGMTMIALVQIILLAGPNAPVSGLALCMLAAMAGFLLFNFNPARVFMGDTGALSAGFFLACASVKATAHLSGLGSVLFVPCLVLFVPVFDMLLVSVTRRANGRAISRGARDHASHRLVLVGLSERQAVGLLYVIAAVAGVMAFLWKSSWADLGAGTVALFLIGAAFFWIYLAKLPLPASWLSASDPGITAVPEFLQQLAMRITGVLSDAALIILGLYFAYVIRVHRLDEEMLGRFLFAAALSLPIKMALLTAFGAYRQGWSITEKRHLSPILETSTVAALLLSGASAALPPSKTLGWSIISTDALFTTALLSLGHASRHILDRVLAKSRLRSTTDRGDSRQGTSQIPEGNPASSQGFETQNLAKGQSLTATPVSNGEPKAMLIIGRLNVGPARQACLLQETLAQEFERDRKMGFLLPGDGTDRRQLEEQIHGCSNAEFLGWRMDIERIWFVADVALLTSRSEGTPISLIEAMTSGLPFAATNVGGVQDLAALPLCELPMGMGYAAANGFLTARTPEALVYCLEQIAGSPQAAKEMGSVGHAVVARFSVQRRVNETRRFFRTLVAQRCKGASKVVLQKTARRVGDMF